MSTDIALDTVSHDLDVQRFDLRLIGDAARVAQQIKIRLLFFLGEWFLDRREGIPYYQDILVKGPDRAIIEGIFRDAINTVPGVTAVEDMTLEYDSPARRLTVTFRAITQYGDLTLSELLEV